MRSGGLFGVMALGVIGLAGCSPFGGDAFSCDTNEQCGAGGQCEDTHFCSFENESKCGPGGRAYGQYSGALANKCTSEEPPTIVDAPPDQPPPDQCTPNVKVCFGDAVETCRSDGQGFDPTQRVACALACDATSGTPLCYAASSIPVADQILCGNTAGDLDLQATSGRVTIKDDEIECSNCAGGVTSIPRRGTNPNTWFCVKSLMLGSNVEVRYESDKVTTLFVAQTAQLDATIDFSGNNGGNGGNGGPGGSRGGGRSDDNAAGKPGQGSCAGGAGGTAGAAATAVGGGGGGAGAAGTGGNGGTGGTAATIASAGTGGPTKAECHSPTGIPLVGGSGGGGGGDGACGAGIACGAAGGGGGGGLQIAVRGDLKGSGSLKANGGGGSGNNIAQDAGGGGGGGSGGTLLVEAHAYMLTGTLEVRGGNGGGVGLRGGGDGAQNTGLNGNNGSNGPAATSAGAGGGGGAGNIRVNAVSAPNACTNAKPTSACMPGSLTPQ